MDIRRLQAFAKVYDLRSFSKAGEEMRALFQEVFHE